MKSLIQFTQLLHTAHVGISQQVVGGDSEKLCQLEQGSFLPWEVGTALIKADHPWRYADDPGNGFLCQVPLLPQLSQPFSKGQGTHLGSMIADKFDRCMNWNYYY